MSDEHRWYVVPEHITEIGRIILYWGYSPIPICNFGTLPLLLHKIPIHLLGEINMKAVIERVDYYVSPILHNQAMVKLGAKATLKNGEIYGNVIDIPVKTLKQLVRDIDNV